MDIVERFLNYVKFDSQSDENSETVPSSAKQWNIARYLKDELEAVGLEDVVLDDMGYVYATLPSNINEEVPTVGFIAHYDTSPDCSGADIKPRIVHYDGGDIKLNEEVYTRADQFPELKSHVGEDIIVTDGTTLLGADDKAGIAEIVQAMVELKEHSEWKHGKIRVAFNPDEEIGMGAHHFNVELFGADFAYTMDGGEVGELEFENFNAASAKITLKGLNVHPGSAKNKMINSSLVAIELNSMLPAQEIPAKTENYEGFFHLIAMSGTVENSTLQYIIRDHDRKKFEARKELMKQVVAKINMIYGAGTATLDMHDQYYNMREKIEPVMFVIDLAKKSMLDAGVTPNIHAIRGGTDGAQLSFKGLPCPNIFAGGLNMHGRNECVPVQSMEKAKNVVIAIAKNVVSLKK